ncbi:hypothetical protein [Maribacter sp. ACAM166]|uniref:hypothetical protein n=1 Tax=Maribacter sp. ACAM166 TaxID=2508996 RepID=UPI0010FF39C2|nr:hypothetical protein [Maribacter sp. ACAM166]TLP77021.1 hypothetical protein ES765_13430 [Maribacter sp. ACAM166]
MQQAGELSTRVYVIISNNKEYVNYFIYKGPAKSDRLNVRSVEDVSPFLIFYVANSSFEKNEVLNLLSLLAM